MKLKVCGMREEDNLQGLIKLSPDYIGFIFYPKSKRYVGDKPDPRLFNQVPAGIKKVGVFVNAHVGEMVQKAETYGLDYLQLHGDETHETCSELHEEGIQLIKAFSVGQDFDFSLLSRYEPYVRYFLFDTRGKEYGGNGITFDWSLLANYPSGKPFFLSGGIGPEHVTDIAGLEGLPLHALDVNSRFESAPALKDLQAIAAFQQSLKITQLS